jgi:hypothetical protein
VNVLTACLNVAMLLHLYCMGECVLKFIAVELNCKPKPASLILINLQIDAGSVNNIALFYSYKNLSKTDIKQSWLNKPKSHLKQEIKTMGEMFPESKQMRYE